jgi:subtilisin family serine protease
MNLAGIRRTEAESPHTKGFAMPLKIRCFSLGRIIALSVALLAALPIAGATQASAEDDDHGRGRGFGTGLAIGVGLGVLQGMTSRPPDQGPPNRPALKKTKATATPPANSGPNGSAKPAPDAGAQRVTGVPPQGEQRYIRDEVLTQFQPGTTQPAINVIAGRYNLTLIESQNFPLLGGTLYRWRLGGRRALPDVIGALERERTVLAAQPNYIFSLQEEAVKPADLMLGDPAQYALGKLHIREAQQLVTGRDVLVAVVDAKIDAGHPDISGTVVKNFNALAGDAAAHKHGTGMAGAIAAHGRLLGIAPGVHVLAARAFDDNADAKATTFSVLKALQWSADNSARVVNMSFAGPLDPAMHRIIAAAYAKDIVFVAAAGNTGPNTPPLFPGSDPAVIAVTATDNNDALFKMSTRGDYVAIAAPGVDILVPAPGGLYEFTTGTSVAAAQVSGIVALLLQRNPTLKPKDVRALLMSSATPLGPQRPSTEFGAGLANAYQAVMSLEGKSVGNDQGAGPAKP